ncbi:MAG: DUF92 domain-containing protein [Candidatus Methanomethylophilaceae archaeon]|nr:DUF92 domain-containing protein [Candidatus Methanomethylophilaceae archaeon]
MLLLPELWMEITVVLALSIVLSFFAYWKDMLTRSGCISAAFMGIVIGLCGSLSWLILLIVFTLLGFVATLIGLSKKREKGLQEGTHGERSYKNVLGVAIPCCVFAFINLFTHDSYYYYMMIGYISTIAVAAADTTASELGTKDSNVYLITTFKKVEPGTDGGISKFGTMVSLLASVFVSFIGWVVINRSLDDVMILIPMLAGFIGCMLDSVVGATLETWGYVNKYENNCITGIAGAAIGVLIAYLL